MISSIELCTNRACRKSRLCSLLSTCDVTGYMVYNFQERSKQKIWSRESKTQCLKTMKIDKCILKLFSGDFDDRLSLNCHVFAISCICLVIQSVDNGLWTITNVISVIVKLEITIQPGSIAGLRWNIKQEENRKMCKNPPDHFSNDFLSLKWHSTQRHPKTSLSFWNDLTTVSKQSNHRARTMKQPGLSNHGGLYLHGVSNC